MPTVMKTEYENVSKWLKKGCTKMGGFGGRNEATMGGVGLQRVASRKVGGFN